MLSVQEINQRLEAAHAARAKALDNVTNARSDFKFTYDNYCRAAENIKNYHWTSHQTATNAYNAANAACAALDQEIASLIMLLTRAEEEARSTLSSAPVAPASSSRDLTAAELLMASTRPIKRVLMQRFRVCNTPKGTRATLTHAMVRHRLHGHLQRVSTTAVVGMAVTHDAGHWDMAAFAREVVALAPAAVSVPSDPRMPYSMWGEPVLSSNPKHIEYMRSRVQLEAVATSIKTAYEDTSNISDDSSIENAEVISNISSQPSSSRFGP
mmetsp:Transcript_30618/g.67817  ORF Transcript_30618/g.67817 Transcript_30618/m.67817 type:complete len:269 (-) Transcript_30618:124-930(-)|eukprot:CAMPEP_0202916326 /NCGR_PEP_ID=MMETSP1392-20130828/68309_1 /ASSEMBLY_ACC=CAM_ASM_000868 /TAXON_ID=225041 /ORGANISM="Chlamydomonas chlamydogama, Strain SAG 11-48b" /LENGTH=268 /DNA_ID=CAMNT_0049608725 /DNA_START=143 /DNA_END=949 /DNA_ORIENTATION=+